MRILWLSHFVPYPPNGGAFTRTHHLLRQAAAVHEVDLVALNQRALLPSDQEVAEATRELAPYVASCAVFEMPADRSRLRYYATALGAAAGRFPFDVAWLRSRDLRHHLAGIPDGVHDLVHVDTSGLWPSARLAPRSPRVLNHHNIESQMMARRSKREPGMLRRTYFRREAGKLARYERAICRTAEMNLVVSALDRDRLVANTGNVPVTVVSNGVDTDYFRPSTDVTPRHRSLVFVGGMKWYPNREAARVLVQELWPLLSGDGDRRLTIVGRRPSPEVLAAAAADPRIRVTGYVDDVRPHLSEAQIYVCPIRDGGGTRLKVLDALATGTPLVATRLAVEGLELIAGRHYLAAETPADFAAQIRRLEEDRELRGAIAEEGRELVERTYSWRSIGHTLREAYDRAVASFAPGGLSGSR